MNLISQPKLIEPFSKRQWSLLAALTLLGAGLRLYKLGQESIWFDEALSIFFARQPFNLSIQQMLEEGLHHTPLYYMLLRPFVWFNPSEAGARTLSALLGIAAIPLIAQFGRVMFSRRVGIYAAILLTINPFHLWYSRETRMYALMALVSTAAMYFFSLCLARRPGYIKWLGLLFSVGVGVNTHHFAYYVILSQFVFLLLTFKKNYNLLRSWALTMLGVSLTLLPWILIVVSAGKYYGSGSALKPTDLYELALTFWNFSIGYTQEFTLGVFLTLTLFFIVLMVGILQCKSNQTGYVVISLLLPPLVAYLLSQRLPMYVDRYLIICLPAYLLLLASGINSLRPNWLQFATGVLLVGIMLLSMFRVYTDDRVYERADWRSLASDLAQWVDPSLDKLVILNYNDVVPLFYYYQTVLQIHPLKVGSRVEIPQDQHHPQSSLWLILPHPNQSTHLIGHCQPFDAEQFPVETPIRTWMAELEPQKREVIEYSCIQLFHYIY